jgi:hypothetical protein
MVEDTSRRSMPNPIDRTIGISRSVYHPILGFKAVVTTAGILSGVRRGPELFSAAARWGSRCVVGQKMNFDSLLDGGRLSAQVVNKSETKARANPQGRP